MQRYSGYTIKRIEEELTWEQVILMLETIKNKNEKQNKNNNNFSSQFTGASNNVEVHDYDLQDIVEEESIANELGFDIDYKEVKTNG